MLTKRNFITTALIILCVSLSNAQDKTFSLYDPLTDATRQIDSLIGLAKTQKKHVFLQVGGNWCKWCRKFHEFTVANKTVDSLLTADFIVGHINYSKENKNPEVMERLGFPQRFGFPVFVILDGNGNRLHTQNTGYLEGSDGYDPDKVIEFLKHWGPGALEREKYN